MLTSLLAVAASIADADIQPRRPTPPLSDRSDAAAQPPVSIPAPAAPPIYFPPPPPITTTRPERISRALTNADYPPFALRARIAGRVSVHVEVGIDGRVIHCSVRQSSGNEQLDLATCDLVTLRHLYRPAMRLGQPVKSTIVHTFTWSLPPDDQ